jgi:hypothetical protein
VPLLFIFFYFLLWTRQWQQAWCRPKSFPSYLPTSFHFAFIPLSELKRAWSEKAKEGGHKCN